MHMHYMPMPYGDSARRPHREGDSIMSDETSEMTPEIGAFMVHNVLDFISTEKGAAAFG